jgi:AraC-like DNA-binding protein
MFYAQNHKTNFPFHTHNTYNISLIFKNSFNLELTNKSFIAPKGSIVITNPSELHATPCDIGIGTSFFTFYIPPSLISFINHNKLAFFKNKVIDDPKIFQQLYSLSITYKNDLINFENEIFKILTVLINKYASTEFFNKKDVRILNEYIDTISLFDNFSLEKTALKFGLNKYKFLRVFKQETGLTPTNYILMKRIDRSKEFLSENKEIIDVALSCGFYDSSHFYRNFIKYTGVSPSEYQNAIILRVQ